MNVYKGLYNFVHGDRPRRYRSSALAVTDKPVSRPNRGCRFPGNLFRNTHLTCAMQQCSAYGARHPGPALRQQPPRPKTPAISNRNARRCTSTVWAIIMHSGILFLIDLVRHSTTSQSKSRKFTQVRVDETNIQSLLCFAKLQQIQLCLSCV